MAGKLTHSFTKKIFNWMYCSHCGLVTLRNEATKKAMKQPCPGAVKWTGLPTS